MKYLYGFVVCGMLLAGTASAKSGSMIMRGGLGFLYADHNEVTSNPAHISLDNGTALEVSYVRQKSTTSDVNAQALTPSIAFGNGTVGLGAFASRASTDISTASVSTDSAGAAGGLSFAKQRLSLGAGYRRVITADPTNSGVITGSFTYNGMNRMGPSIGLGTNYTLNKSSDNTMSAIAALGYAFKDPNNNIEATFEFPDVKTTSSYIISGYFTLMAKMFYFSGGYNYIKDTSTDPHQVQGRVGVVLGTMVDISGIIIHRFIAGGSNPLFGGALRASF